MEVNIEREGRRVRVNLNGRFDLKSNLTFRNATRPLLGESDIDAIVIGFTNVSFVDSSALGLLLLLREQATNARKTVILSNCGQELTRLLSISQFHTIFPIE